MLSPQPIRSTEKDGMAVIMQVMITVRESNSVSMFWFKSKKMKGIALWYWREGKQYFQQHLGLKTPQLIFLLFQSTPCLFQGKFLREFIAYTSEVSQTRNNFSGLLKQEEKKKKIKQFLGKNSEFVACKGNAFLVLDHEGMAKGMPLCLEHLNSSSPLASDPAY